MRLLIFWLFATIVVASCNSNTSQSQQKTVGFLDTLPRLYEDDDVIVVKKPQSFLGDGLGEEIDDALMEQMVKRYRSDHPSTEVLEDGKTPKHTYYLNFSLDSIHKYILRTYELADSMRLSRDSLGLRIYLGYEDKKKRTSIMLSPSYNSKAMWRQNWTDSAKLLLLDVKALNQGSICPTCYSDRYELP